MTPHATLLHAVARLHEDGFEGVRVLPYFYSLGTWRLELTIGGDVLHPVGDSFFAYSSAAGWNFFGDFDQPTTVRRLATRLQRRIPDRDAARQAAPGYRVWFAMLLEHCGAQSVPYFFREYEDCRALGYVGITSDGGGGTTASRFPLPPG